MMNTVFVIIMMWQTYSGDHENQGKDNHDGTAADNDNNSENYDNDNPIR